jgi:ketosteroid isomerase-like protein
MNIFIGKADDHMNRSITILFTVYCVLSATPCMAREPSPKTVVENRFVAVRRHDVEAIVALYANDAAETSPAFCTERSGPEGVRRTYTELFQAFPAITDDVTSIVVEGERVAVQFTARSKKADGSYAFEVPLANFLVVRHGRIVRDDTYFDTHGRPCS